MAFTFNRKSWHYRLVDAYSPVMVETCSNICPYFRGVTIGIIWALLITGFLGGAAGCVGSFFAYLVVCAKSLTWLDLDGTAGVGAFILAAAAIIAVVGGLCYWAHLRSEARRERLNAGETFPEPWYKRFFCGGFLEAAYRKFHDKTCIPITLSGYDDKSHTGKSWKYGAMIVGPSLLVVALYFLVA